MKIKNSKLSELKNLIMHVEDADIQRMLLSWVEKNIYEYGIFHDVNNEHLAYIKGKEADYQSYQLKSVASDIGFKLMNEAAEKEVYDTPYGRRTTYRLWAIKESNQNKGEKNEKREDDEN